ncbi:hypothetical protein Tco_0403627 [Tanacetum coccineum]
MASLPGMAEVASYVRSLAFCKRLVEDDEEEDEESSDFDSVSEGIEDEGPTIKDEDPARGLRVLLSGMRPAPSIVPSPISSPMIPLTVPSPVASPATAETEGFLTELGARVKIQGGLIRDHTIRLEELSPALFERPVLALESWAGQTDAQGEALWHAISETQGENQELRLLLAKERRTRLELAEVVDSMRRGQEPRGDV